MSTAVTARPVTADQDASTTAPAPKVVGVIWALLMINVLGFVPTTGMLVPVPKPLAQLLTMGSLLVAFFLALAANPRVKVRLNSYLTLLSLLAMLAVLTSLRLESGAGSLLRCFRLCVFVATLWLISRWWRGDLRFLLFHIRVLSVTLLTAVLGMIISPGAAFSQAEGRLEGILWPIPATQLGQYAAMAIGLAAVMWWTDALRGADTVVIIGPALVLLLLSHTRTALLAMIVGLVLAAGVLCTGSRRVRRSLVAAAIFGILALAFQSLLITWLSRGQSEDDLSNLTGRQKVWDALLAEPRTPVQNLIGVGLTDKSYGGLPIDSSYISAYHELGLVGVGIIAAIIVMLLARSVLQRFSHATAYVLFIAPYCAIAGYTEVGLGDASPYLLHLAVAASLLPMPLLQAAQRRDSQREEPLP